MDTLYINVEECNKFAVANVEKIAFLPTHFHNDPRPGVADLDDNTNEVYLSDDIRILM
jgi:hypothetical protein